MHSISPSLIFISSLIISSRILIDHIRDVYIFCIVLRPRILLKSKSKFIVRGKRLYLNYGWVAIWLKYVRVMNCGVAILECGVGAQLEFQVFLEYIYAILYIILYTIVLSFLWHQCAGGII